MCKGKAQVGWFSKRFAVVAVAVVVPGITAAFDGSAALWLSGTVGVRARAEPSTLVLEFLLPTPPQFIPLSPQGNWQARKKLNVTAAEKTTIFYNCTQKAQF